MHFWSFWAKYCHLLHILSNARPKTNVNKVPRLVFCYVGNKTYDFSSKKKDFLPKNDQIWPKIGTFVHLLIWCPVGGLVGSCGAQAVSCKTPIYFIEILCIYTKHTHWTNHNKQIQNIQKMHCSHESHKNAHHAQMRYYNMYIVHVAQQEKCFESEFERHSKQ